MYSSIHTFRACLIGIRLSEINWNFDKVVLYSLRYSLVPRISLTSRSQARLLHAMSDNYIRQSALVTNFADYHNDTDIFVLNSGKGRRYSSGTGWISKRQRGGSWFPAPVVFVGGRYNRSYTDATGCIRVKERKRSKEREKERECAHSKIGLSWRWRCIIDNAAVCTCIMRRQS